MAIAKQIQQRPPHSVLLNGLELAEWRVDGWTAARGLLRLLGQMLGMYAWLVADQSMNINK